MGFVIAILITLAMAGSVMWVMPSPREKRLTAMRSAAMASGLKVRLLEAKSAAALYPWLKDYRSFVSYELPFLAGKSLKIKQPVVVRIALDEQAHELDHIEPLRVALEQQGVLSLFPDDAEALVIYSGGISLLWMEAGNVAEVAKIREGLGACMDLNLEKIYAGSRQAEKVIVG